MRIEAPPEAADELLGLPEGLVALLQQARAERPGALERWARHHVSISSACRSASGVKTTLIRVPRASG